MVSELSGFRITQEMSGSEINKKSYDILFVSYLFILQIQIIWFGCLLIIGTRGGSRTVSLGGGGANYGKILLYFLKKNQFVKKSELSRGLK